MAYPKKLGAPCWDPAQVEKAISSLAQTTDESIPYFLAAHSPFARISDAKGKGRHLSEEQVFAELFSGGSEVQAFVKGEPGTGKSHLIRWLKLRTDYAAKHKLGGFELYRRVLVSRGNGSLKDALRQIVEQLGGEFKKHADRVQGAIENLSAETARAKLCDAIAIELDRGRIDRGLPPLERDLEHLGQAFHAKGFGDWLQRDEGVVAQVIRRLTDSSTEEQREEGSPHFTPEELKAPIKYLKQTNNSNEVVGLIGDIKEDLELAERACAALNSALEPAKAELTGLKGSDLIEIFTEIRRSLHKQGKQLAVFIEDVSIMGFNQEVVNAFEPRPGDSRCRMVAVLGTTNDSWDSTEKNQRDRGTHVYEVGGATVKEWANDQRQIGQFAARYLNAVRMSDAEVKGVAEQRFSGDVTRSKCDKCPLQKDCFSAFGSVELEGGASIGMFPFNAVSPHKLLHGLQSESFYLSQRGLLKLVMLPALGQSAAAFDREEFPQASAFGVQGRTLNDWDGFVGKYCGGSEWEGDKVDRLKFLAQFWTDGQTADELAASLEPLRAPFHLPVFSNAPKIQKIKKAEPGPAAPTPPTPVADKELESLTRILEDWKGGKRLKQDEKFRDLLQKLLWKSICWQDERGTPFSVAKNLIGENKKYPRIHGQETRPAAQLFFVDFQQDEETFGLLLSLLKFDRQGGKGWGFEHSELHKRKMSRWLRKNRGRIVGGLRPETDQALPGKAVAAAVQALAVMALLRDRRPIVDIPEAVGRLFQDVWGDEDVPSAISDGLRDIIDDLRDRHDALRTMLEEELGVPQGATGDPGKFVDPAQIISALKRFVKAPQVEVLPDGSVDSYWKVRLSAVASLKSLRGLPKTLKDEQESLSDAVKRARKFFEDCGYPQSDGKQALKSSLAEAAAAVKMQKEIYPVGSRLEFDELWKSGTIQMGAGEWGAPFSRAETLAEGKGGLDILAFDPNPIASLLNCIDLLKRYLESVEEELSKQLAHLEGGGAGSSKKLLDGLAEMARMSEGKVGGAYD